MFGHAGLHLLHQQSDMLVVSADLLQGLDEGRAIEVGGFGNGRREVDADVVDAAVVG